MRNSCPSCQTVYAVTPADIGRRIARKRCQAVLVIDEKGLRYETPIVPPAASIPESKEKAQPDEEEELEDRDVEEKIKKRKQKNHSLRLAMFPELPDIATILFTTGTALVIMFLFLPLIGSAKVERKEGQLKEEKFEYTSEIKKLKEKNDAESLKQSKKVEEAWPKRREVLENEKKSAEYSNLQSKYFDRYGLMLGYLTLALGSIRFMSGDQPGMKRVVGAVVVTAQMLLVFTSFVIRG